MPNVTTIQEAKDVNTISPKSQIRNLQSQEMEYDGDEPTKKSKSFALKCVTKHAKSSKIWDSEDATHVGTSEEDFDDEEMAFIIKRFWYQTERNKRFSGKSSGFRGSSYREKKEDCKGSLLQKVDTTMAPLS